MTRTAEPAVQCPACRHDRCVLGWIEPRDFDRRRSSNPRAPTIGPGAPAPRRPPRARRRAALLPEVRPGLEPRRARPRGGGPEEAHRGEGLASHGHPLREPAAAGLPALRLSRRRSWGPHPRVRRTHRGSLPARGAAPLGVCGRPCRIARGQFHVLLPALRPGLGARECAEGDRHPGQVGCARGEVPVFASYARHVAKWLLFLFASAAMVVLIQSLQTR